MAKSRILIVEDDRIIAEDIATSLEESGYEIVSVESSGGGALERARQDKPDLVLMDIILKGEVDGIEAAGNIRSRYQIPVVYLTSHADETTLKRAKETAPFGYLLKPFGRKELEITVEIALYKHKMEEEREKLIGELQEALDTIKTLEGFLPICAWCKKIRNDDGYWEQLEHYISKHSKAKFSHGICEECIKEKYPEVSESA